MAPSFSGILYDRTFFDMIESLKDNANILVQKQGLPFMFNHFFFFENFLCKSSLCSTTFILQRVAVVFSVESLVQSNLLSIESLLQSNFVWTLEINTDRITNQPTNRILNRLSRSPLHELFWYQCEKIVSVNHFQTASNSSLLLPYPVLILE